jgi:hypothetical protein
MMPKTRNEHNRSREIGRPEVGISRCDDAQELVACTLVGVRVPCARAPEGKRDEREEERGIPAHASWSVRVGLLKKGWKKRGARPPGPCALVGPRRCPCAEAVVAGACRGQEVAGAGRSQAPPSESSPPGPRTWSVAAPGVSRL